MSARRPAASPHPALLKLQLLQQQQDGDDEDDDDDGGEESRHNKDDVLSPTQIALLFGKPPSSIPSADRRPSLPPAPRKPLPTAVLYKASVAKAAQLYSSVDDLTEQLDLGRNPTQSLSSNGSKADDERRGSASSTGSVGGGGALEKTTSHESYLMNASDEDLRWISTEQRSNDFGIYLYHSSPKVPLPPLPSQKRAKPSPALAPAVIIEKQDDLIISRKENLNNVDLLIGATEDDAESTESQTRDPEKGYTKYSLSHTLSGDDLEMNNKRGSIQDRVRMFESRPLSKTIHISPSASVEMHRAELAPPSPTNNEFATSQEYIPAHKKSVDESFETGSAKGTPVRRSLCGSMDSIELEEMHKRPSPPPRLIPPLLNFSMIEKSDTIQLFDNPDALLETTCFSDLSRAMDDSTGNLSKSGDSAGELKLSENASSFGISRIIVKSGSSGFGDDVFDEEFVNHMELKSVHTNLLDPSVSDVSEVRHRIDVASFEFLKVFSNEDVQKLLKIDYPLSNSLMKAFAYVFLDCGRFESVVRDIIVFDMERAGSAFEIFRTNTDQVRSMISLTKGLAKNVLVHAVKPVVDDIMGMGSGVDLFYSNLNDASEQVLNCILPLADKVLSTTLAMLSSEGAADSLDLQLMRKICAMICFESSDRFLPSYCGIGVISLLFLRFLCPCIIDPKGYGIVSDDVMDITVHRNLVALAKILQSIAGSYSQTESLDDKPPLYKSYVQSKVKSLEMFFGDLLTSKFSFDQVKLPSKVTAPKCVKFIAAFLQEASQNIACLELITPGVYQLHKNGGGVFSVKARKILISAVHGKLFYIRPDSPNTWSGCVDLLSTRFDEPAKTGRNSKGTFFEITNMYGVEMRIKSWKNRNGEFPKSNHKSMLFWGEDREKMLTCLKAIHEVQGAMGLNLGNMF